MENECKFIAIIGLIGAGGGMVLCAGMAQSWFSLLIFGVGGLLAGFLVAALCAYLGAGFVTGVLCLLRRFA